MLKRDEYIKQIVPFIDKDVIKVLTGIRRSGKSVMLKLLMEELKNRGINENQFIYINFENLKLVIRPASNGMEEAAIKYGAFIQSVVDFLIIAVCIFLFVKLANTLTRKKEEEKKPEKPSADVVLLTEIRDLLKKKN